MKKISAKNLRPHSSVLVDGPERAAARAMLYPVGFKEEDFKKPIIGIASTWSNVTPCNMHIDKLSLEAEKGANEGGGKAIAFNPIPISDGISLGSEGMKYSLVSRVPRNPDCPHQEGNQTEEVESVANESWEMNAGSKDRS